MSTQMLYEDDIQVLYEKIIDTAMKIMHSDFGSMQVMHRERGESGALRLMVHKGFTPLAAKFWEWVDNEDNTACSLAMKNRSSIIVPDIEKWDIAQGTKNLAVFRQTGIRSCQSTPLVSRNGEFLGIYSTHWRQPHTPTEREMNLISILARQAADLIERKKMEELLKKSNVALERSIEMKDEFLSLISHEFRTPLTVIISAVQMLKTFSWNELSDKAKGYFNTIRQNSNRQLKLVNNILDITKINAGSFEVHKTNSDIVQLTKLIIESIEPYADRKKINVSFSFAPAEMIIGIDEEKYERILLNLLSNAIKYTPKGESITVKLSKNIVKNKAMACIQVCDNGIGIPVDKQGLIFERFGQVDSVLSRQTEGTGIGLHLTRMFVEMLGGEIKIDSKLGTGSTFTFLLPAVKVKETHTEKMAHVLADNRTIQLTDIEFSDIYLDKQ
jgi:signal transduction histidine kinase